MRREDNIAEVAPANWGATEGVMAGSDMRLGASGTRTMATRSSWSRPTIAPEERFTDLWRLVDAAPCKQ